MILLEIVVACFIKLDRVKFGMVKSDLALTMNCGVKEGGGASDARTALEKKLWFLMKAVCFYTKNLKDYRHEAFLKHHRPEK